jgi:hypothetical protein
MSPTGDAKEWRLDGYEKMACGGVEEEAGGGKTDPGPLKGLSLAAAYRSTSG